MGEEPEIQSTSLWWRFTAGSVLIIATIATAVSVSTLIFLTDLAGKLHGVHGVHVAPVDPGKPETILIVGSDKREGTPGDPGRSDTTMLLRVDGENGVLSLFSLPRDLRVDIAGRNFGKDKLNAAYTYGGLPKTVSTVQRLTGLDINHVVNVDFQGFADAVDVIGCVYVDVDRQYEHSNDGLTGIDTYAEIHVNSGYQRLCGEKALQYVRYRHTDTDFVRSARQQDFLSNARHQVPAREVLPLIGGNTGSKLLKVFTDYTQSDIDTPDQVLSVLKAFLAVRDVPVKEVHFVGSDATIGGVDYVTTTPEQMKAMVTEFLGERDDAGSGDSSSKGGSEDHPGDSGGETAKPKAGGGSKAPEADQATDLISTADVAASTGVDKFAAFGRTSSRRLDLPVYVPTEVASWSSYDAGSRQYEIKDPDDNRLPSYKLVIKLSNPATNEEYYGVEGTTWDDPPILDGPHDTVSADGRDYDVYYVGDRVRLVAFHEDGNSYWVSNTLLQTLDESQMLAIAESLEEAHP